jgi:outer membrane immunogenic protein
MTFANAVTRGLLPAFAALAALLADGVAAAGDLLEPAPAYSPPFTVGPGPIYDWTGFYAGINGGGSFGHFNWTSDPDLTSGTVSPSSGLIGVTLGYNMQNLGPLVVGAEFDFGWREFNVAFGPASCASNCELTSRWISTARVRFGYLMGSFLPYVTGGVAISDAGQDIVGQAFGVARSVTFNWTAGAGVEFVISDPLTVKLEYLYVDHSIPDCNDACGVGPNYDSLPIHMGLSENIFRIGLNYRLWGR